MEQLDIIGQLEAYALAKGWRFVYGYNKFRANIDVMHDYQPGELVLIADFRATPTIKNGRVTQMIYTCLLMLGRKFDIDGTVASLDETPIQKYDRRLKELAQTLLNTICDFSCANELEVTAAPISVDINVYDTNIDLAISENATFVQ